VAKPAHVVALLSLFAFCNDIQNRGAMNWQIHQITTRSTKYRRDGPSRTCHGRMSYDCNNSSREIAEEGQKGGIPLYSSHNAANIASARWTPPTASPKSVL